MQIWYYSFFFFNFFNFQIFAYLCLFSPNIFSLAALSFLRFSDDKFPWNRRGICQTIGKLPLNYGKDVLINTFSTKKILNRATNRNEYFVF